MCVREHLPVSWLLRLTISGLFLQSKEESRWRKRRKATCGELRKMEKFTHMTHNKQRKTCFLHKKNKKKKKSKSGGYLGAVKGAGCRKSDATSRSAVSSVMSSLNSWALSQRLARRHAAPKHGCCCWSLQIKRQNAPDWRKWKDTTKNISLLCHTGTTLYHFRTFTHVMC